MQIIDLKINWWAGYGNGPSVAILVDKIPPREELHYEHKPPGIYYAEEGGYVSFFYKSDKLFSKQEDGFAGRHFPLKMKGGTEKVLKGPWSSNSGSVNAYGFGPCTEVSITEEKQTFESGGGVFFGAACKVDKLIDYILRHSIPIKIIREVKHYYENGEFSYTFLRKFQGSDHWYEKTDDFQTETKIKESLEQHLKEHPSPFCLVHDWEKEGDLFVREWMIEQEDPTIFEVCKDPKNGYHHRSIFTNYDENASG